MNDKAKYNGYNQNTAEQKFRGVECGDLFMYDLCDVLHASHGSADVISHVLCDFGEGNMGNGIRKLAGEVLTVASRKGYDNGFGDGYHRGYSTGVVKGSILTFCVAGVFAVGIRYVNKTIAYHKKHKADKEWSDAPERVNGGDDNADVS